MALERDERDEFQGLSVILHDVKLAENVLDLVFLELLDLLKRALFDLCLGHQDLDP